MSKRVEFANEELYHICYRAVGDTMIFKDEDDYFRGIFSLYEFNHSRPVNIWLRRLQRKKEKLLLGRTSQSLDGREKFVEILAFCFMPNHIHLILKQIKDGGISKFMQKVGGGYATYFNKKYKRKGHLFNQFKAFHITSDDQLKNVITYVHCNPISIIEPGFKENGIKDVGRIMDYLGKEYRWSSFFDYLGKNNFASITTRDFILESMGESNGVKQAVEDWVNYKGEVKQFDDTVLE